MRMAGLILKNAKFGKGVFAQRKFFSGEKILEFHGKTFTFEELPKPYESVSDHYMQIGETLYMGPSGEFDDYLNHSCEPNSGIRGEGGALLLIAIRDIAPGEEITWDYSTHLHENFGWTMECGCASTNCRKVIGDFQHLPPELQKRYLNMGIVIPFIAKKYSKNFERGADKTYYYG